MPETSNTNLIWLEVTNVRSSIDKGVEIQVKGDRGDREPVWWKVSSDAYTDFQDNAKAYRTLTEGLDKKRIVLAALGPPVTPTSPPDTDAIVCKQIRIQYAESNR